jgi:hypothetical protein
MHYDKYITKFLLHRHGCCAATLTLLPGFFDLRTPPDPTPFGSINGALLHLPLRNDVGWK